MQAYYNGRTVGRADVTVGTDGACQSPGRGPPASRRGAKDPAVDALVTRYATDPDYLALVNQPVGYCAVDLGRSNTGDNMMGTFIDDAIYSYLNTDARAGERRRPVLQQRRRHPHRLVLERRDVGQRRVRRRHPRTRRS